MKTDPILVYMTLKMGQHLGKLDRQYVEQVFESYSFKSKESAVETKVSNTNNDRVDLVTKGNAVLAYEEIFKLWKIALNVQQQTRVKTAYFEQAWERFAEDGNLNLRDAWRFFRDMMTTPLLQKDQTIQNILNTAQANQNDLKMQLESSLAQTQTQELALA